MTLTLPSGSFALAHQLVHEAGLVRTRRRGRVVVVTLPLDHESIERLRLLVVEQVRALVALLHVPEVAHVHHRVVARRAGADHDHATAVGHEDRGRDRVLPGVFEHDARDSTFSPTRIPDRLAERLGAGEPVLPLGRVPRRRHAPMAEVLAVDGSPRRQATSRTRPSRRSSTTATGRPPAFATSWIASDPSPPEPPQTSTTSPGSTVLGRPAEEHPVRRGARECRRGGLLPCEVVGFRQALVRLHLAELRERAPARVVAPHPEARRQPRVPARRHPGVVLDPTARRGR